MKRISKGRKDLFQNLAIEKLETAWEQYPVLHLDLNARKYETAADLIAMLNQYLEKWELLYGSEKKDRSSRGRADAVVKTDNAIYVFEFKLGGTAEAALKQIDEKWYLIPYTLDGQKMVKVDVNFSKETRNVDKYIVVEMNKC